VTGKIWQSAYQPGIPVEIDTNKYTSLNEMLELNCSRYSNLPALSNMGRTLTFADLERESRHFAAYLQNVLRLPKGARIALMLPNLLQYPVTFFGVLRAGLIVVNVNPLYTSYELQRQIKDSSAQAVVVLETFAYKLVEFIELAELKAVITTGPGDLLPAPRRWLTNFVARHIGHRVTPYRFNHAIAFRQALVEGSSNSLIKVDIVQDDIALLQYTGGTTGIPKGATLSHGNLVANVVQIATWIGRELHEGVEVAITPLPLFHIFSLTANLLTFISIGGHNLLITDPRDITALVAFLRRTRFTAMTGVNTLFNELLNHPDFAKVDFSRLKLTVGGGAAVHAAVAKRWKEITGVPITEGYGLTEASPVVCINPLDIEDYTGMIGVPIPSTDVTIRDDNGNDLPIGEIGEICVSGPQVMKGYWNAPDETAKVIRADGWLFTGDVGYMREDGFIKFVDRKKDVIVVSGFKVFPNEVEDAAVTHPGVLEAGAKGVADARSDEAVKLFVVKRDPCLTEQELMAHLRRMLAAYKVPKIIEFRDQLPKNAIGKVVRHELR
jgi:long-chain acyl-CoA synthetase